MNISMRLTLDGLLRALRGRVHTLADEIVPTGRTKAKDGRRDVPSPDQSLARTDRDDRARR